MTEKEFCIIYTQFHGDGIDDIKQLVKQVYTGEELLEFCSFVEKSILSRPEQGGEEKKIVESFLTTAGFVSDRNGEFVCTHECNHKRIEGRIGETFTELEFDLKVIVGSYAQLRTSQLRAELDEANKEIEKLTARSKNIQYPPTY